MSGSGSRRLQINENTFKVKEAGVSVLDWSLSLDYTTFVYNGADLSDAQYLLGGLVSELAIASGGRWRNWPAFSIGDFSQMWVQV